MTQPAANEVFEFARVREATITDIRRIHVLAQELLEMSVYAGIKMDDTKFRRTCASLIGSKTGAVFVVVDDEGEVQGFLMGMIDELFFSKARFATDLATYVRKEYRHLAPFMVKRFAKWAFSKTGVKEITLGISSGMDTVDRAGRMYRAIGFKPAGGVYVMQAGG